MRTDSAKRQTADPNASGRSPSHLDWPLPDCRWPFRVCTISTRIIPLAFPNFVLFLRQLVDRVREVVLSLS